MKLDTHTQSVGDRLIEGDSSPLPKASFSGKLSAIRRAMSASVVGASVVLGSSNEVGAQAVAPDINNINLMPQDTPRLAQNPYVPRPGVYPQSTRVDSIQVRDDRGNVTGTVLIEDYQDRGIYYTPLFALRRISNERGGASIFAQPIPSTDGKGIYLNAEILLFSPEIEKAVNERLRDRMGEDAQIAQPLPISDFYLLLVDRGRGNEVIGAGKSGGVSSLTELDRFSIRIPAANDRRFEEALERGDLGYICLYRFDHRNEARGVVHSTGSLEVGHMVERSFDQNQISGDSPILREDRDRFLRQVRLESSTQIRVSSMELMPYVMGIAQDNLAQRLFTTETAYSLDDLRTVHPEVEAGLAAYLTPHLIQFRNAAREYEIDVELTAERSGQQSGARGGASFFGLVSHSQELARFRELLAQLEKTTGVEFIEEEVSGHFRPHRVSLSFLTRGSQEASISSMANLAVELPSDDSYIATNTFSLNHTEDLVVDWLGGYTDLGKLVATLREENQALGEEVEELKESNRTLSDRNDELDWENRSLKRAETRLTERNEEMSESLTQARLFVKLVVDPFIHEWPERRIGLVSGPVPPHIPERPVMSSPRPMTRQAISQGLLSTGLIDDPALARRLASAIYDYHEQRDLLRSAPGLRNITRPD